jgi:hypothetical protein
MKDLEQFFKYGIGGGLAFIITFSLTYFLTEKIKNLLSNFCYLRLFCWFFNKFYISSLYNFPNQNRILFSKIFKIYLISNFRLDSIFFVFSFFYRDFKYLLSYFFNLILRLKLHFKFLFSQKFCFQLILFHHYL